MDATGSRTTWSLDGKRLAQTPSLAPFNPNFRTVASKSGGYVGITSPDSLVVFDVNSGKALGRLAWDEPNASGFSDDESILWLINRSSGVLRIFELSTLKPLAEFDDNAYIANIQTTEDGPILLVGTRTPKASVHIRSGPRWTAREIGLLPTNLFFVWFGTGCHSGASKPRQTVVGRGR